MKVSLWLYFIFCECIWQLNPVHGDYFNACSDRGRCYEECTFDGPCDKFPPIMKDLNGGLVLYRTSSYTGEKFAQSLLSWTPLDTSKQEMTQITLTVNTNVHYQTLYGFGGAFTDAMNANLAKVPSDIKDDIIHGYFALDDERGGGSGFTIGRVPMASCDFSEYSYTYAPVPDDFELESFNLTEEWDTGPNGKIANIQTAQSYVDANGCVNNSNTYLCHLKLYATPWTAPPWMKLFEKGTVVDDGFVGGYLNPNRTYWQTWANYFVRFLQAYRSYSNGAIDFFAVTVQNEPLMFVSWESTHWTPEELTEFVADFLGPTLEKNVPEVEIWVHDDQKGLTPKFVEAYFSNAKAVSYISAVALHWYDVPPPVPGCVVCTGAFDHVTALNTYLSEKSEEFNKTVYIIATEACTGEGAPISPPKKGVDLGNWNRGTQYAEDIIGDLNCGAVSWVDWNMVLDIEGGPNHANNTCDAPIVIDFDKQMYYKQPMYYMMAQITRFLRPGTIRVQVQRSDDTDPDSTLWIIAGVDADNVSSPNRTVLVILNTDPTYTKSLKIVDARFGYTLLYVPPHSIQTLLWDV